MLNPKHLSLEISQTQSNNGLVNVPNPRHLGLTISQTLGKYRSGKTCQTQNIWKDYRVLQLCVEP